MNFPVRLREPDLRAAMREPRYWSAADPEQAAFRAWVTDGWRGLHPPDAAPREAVWVRPCLRDGHAVRGHWRSPPPRGADDAGFQPASWSRFGRGRQSRGPTDGRGDRQRRIAGPDGRDRVDELRNDPGTRPDPDRPFVAGGSRQWERDGGIEQRRLDIGGARPGGQAESGPEWRLTYELRDGRRAIVRESASGRHGNPPTPEIQSQPEGGGRSGPTDKFRSRDGGRRP